MKIGIMGGTFDPVHNGHLSLAEEAYRKFDLDEVWFMPNGNPPHKTSHAPTASAQQRADMVEQAISGMAHFRLEDYELQNDEVSYSYQTMEHLKHIYPEHRFFFIIGADSLFSLDDWMEPARLLACCTILAACRGEIDTSLKMDQQIVSLKQKYNADIKILPMPLMPASSQEIRASLQGDGKAATLYLPAAALDYIETNRLYKG